MQILEDKRIFTTQILTRVSFLIALSIILSRFFGLMIPVVGFPVVKVSFGQVPIMLAGILYGPKIGFLCGFLADYLGSMISGSGTGFYPGMKELFSVSAGLTGMIPGMLFIGLEKMTNKIRLNFDFMNTLFLSIIVITTMYVLQTQSIMDTVQPIFYQGKYIYLFVSMLFIGIFLFLRLFNKYTHRFVKAFLGVENILVFKKLVFIVCVTRITTSVFLNTYILSFMFKKSFLLFLPSRVVANFIMIPLLAISLTLIVNIIHRVKN